MTYHTLGPTFAAGLRRRLIWRTAPLLLLAVLVGSVVAFSDAESLDAVGPTLALVLPVLAVAVGVGLYRGTKAQAERWEGFRVGVGDDQIVWWMGGGEHVIRRDGVERVRRARGGGLLVEGRGNALWIPPETDGYDDLKQSLGVRDDVTKAPLPVLPYVASVATVAAFGTVMVSGNPWLVLPLGTALAGGLTYSVVAARRAAMPYSSLIWLPILAVIARMAMAVAG